MARTQILIATTNPGKIDELRAMLGNQIEVLGLADIPGIGHVQEDGQTFAENALKKASSYARASGLWTLSDDSGLQIDALGGQPGVTSARFAGVQGEDRRAIDKANIRKVLELMRSVPWQDRTARFVCHLCLASADKVLAQATGVLEGMIAFEPAGQHGFGYDPIFFLPTLNCTLAQLGPEQKNAISHRGKALKALIPQLKALLSG